MDALAFERHFIDHLAPIWTELAARGRFLTDATLADHAALRGIDDPLTYSGAALRRSSPPPKAQSGDGPPALVASIGDIKIGRRLGYRRFVFLEHGAGQSYAGLARDRRAAAHGSYAGGVDRDDVELFLCPNETSASRWSAAYPSAAVRIVGSPRLDTLPRRDPGPGPVVAVSWHWDCPLVPETRPAFHHFKDALPELARRFTVIGHAHPRFLATAARHYRRLGIEVVEDFADVCRQADVYVCDNSSTLYEFAATSRPVVVLNAPWYRREVHHGLRFWDAAGVGIQVDRAGDLVAAVERALEDPPELAMARESALAIAYGLRSNGTAAAVTAISDWLASAHQVAA